MLISPCSSGLPCVRHSSGSLFRPLCLLAAAFVVAGIAAPPAHAGTTDSWLGGFGSWTAPNWSIHTPPGYPDNGFPAGATYDAVIGVPGSDVTLGIGIFLDNLSIGAGDTLEITSGSAADIKTYAGAGTLSNAGMIDLEITTPGSGSSIIFDGSGVPGSPVATLSGGGTIMMAAGTTISGTPGATSPITLTTDNLIMGGGGITGLNLVNHGTINADIPMATLSIAPAGTTGTVKNVGTGAPMSGVLEATGGGMLSLGIGVYDNTDPTHPGTISAGGGSKITLGSTGGGTTVIKGGTLSTLAGDPGSFITNVKIAALNGVTLAPGTKYGQGDFAQTALEGTITNGGSISAAASGMFGPAGTSVIVLDSGDATLGGTGGITLFGFAIPGGPPDPNLVKIWGFAGMGGAPRLTLGASQTITGSGQIGSHSTVLSPKLTNHGTITAMTLPPGALPAQGITIFPVVDPMTGAHVLGALVNDGTIQASENSFLTISNGEVSNGGGTIAAHGTMMPSTVTLQGTVEVYGGTILLDGPLSQLQLNGAFAALTTLTNSSGGMIATVAPSTSNSLGGAITNSGPGSSIMVKDNSSLEILDNFFYGTVLTNSAIIAVGTGAVAVGPAELTIDQGTVTNTGGTIVIAANGTLQLKGGAGTCTVNGGMIQIAQAGGKVDLDEAVVHNGTLTNTMGGFINSAPFSTNTLGGTVNNNGGATISVYGSTLKLETGGTYINAGTINIEDAGAGANAALCPSGAGGTVTLSGGGMVNLKTADSSIFGVNATETLVNVDNTISGGGTIKQMSLTNRFMGIIQSSAAFGPLTIDPNSNGAVHQFINGGVIQTQGATLNLVNSTANATFTNIDGGNLGTIRAGLGDTLNLTGGNLADAVIDNGFVQVLPGATLNLSHGTIHHGTLTVFGGGAGGVVNSIAATVNTLGGTVTNNLGATINVQAGSTLNLESGGIYSNAGTINVNAAANSNLCPKGAGGTVTLTGAGTVNLLGAGSSIFGTTDGSETLVNQDNTISGGGSIGQGKLALTNRGLIDVNIAAGMTIQPNSTGATNSGTIQANGGPLTLTGGTFTNFEPAMDGVIQAVGADTINLTGADADHNAVIDGGSVKVLAAGTINLSFGTIHGGTLTNSATGTINSAAGSTNTLGGTVNNPAGGVIALASPSTLKLETGGTYNNAGTITVTGSDLRPSGAGGAVTLSGGGTVTLASAPLTVSNIYGTAGNERLINLDNTINGTGQIGLHLMSLTNDATIDADAAPGITIAPNSGGVINGGILQASQSSTLTLDGGIYTNTTGTIQAIGAGFFSNSEVDLKTGVTINGGILSSGAEDLIRVVDEAVLNTVTNNANLAQNEGSILDLIGAITNNGTIVMPATHFVTQIRLLSGNVTLNGTGSLLLQHSGLNQILAANGLDRLTIGSSQTVRGTGNIGVGAMALTNNGKIIADQPTALTIQPNLIGFLNTGTLQAAAGSTLNVIGGYTQTAGDTNVLGTLNVTTGPLTAGGGTLSGSGQSNISGGFSLTGNFTKLDSGTAMISGPENFNSGKTLAINSGVVKFNVSSGPVTVGSGVTATIASGAQLELAGTVSALAAGSNRVNIVNNSSAPGVLVSGKNQQVGGIDGSGTTQVNAGSDLTANHIIQTSLMIGGTAASAGVVTIAPSDASGNPLVGAQSGQLISSAGSVNSLALMAGELPTSPFALGAVNASIPLTLSEEIAGAGSTQDGTFVPDVRIVGTAAVVPEPATLILLALGAIVFFGRAWLKQRIGC